MRKNPFSPLYDACNAGDSKQKHANLPDFPRIIDVEMTNLCNFRCLMCPTGNFSQKRDKGFLSEEVFERILDSIDGHNVGLRFIRWGEPLMHPQLIPFLTAAKAKGALLHLNTNGSHLTEELARALLDVPIDSIKFSFQGVDRKSYAEMRNIDFFDGLIEKIELLHRLRGNSPAPFIQVSTTITYETPAQVEEFHQRFSPLADVVNVGHTSFDWLDLNAVRLRPHEVEMLQKLKEVESVERVHPECPEVFDKLSINWNGKVTACCMDSDDLMVIGDLNESSLGEIWRCDKMEHYRRMLADMRHDELPLCASCWDTHSLSKPGTKEDDK